ncbi:phosphatase PAP2 family protein [Sediminibacillus dalangtanensis]|uniref:Phosphatase PAP2 family protein n=1 Tax=Sediminibacillus dalangtanensis TaxID=2729421 RepID=A0ABX7VP31_9BACI|nr:phosphatase PAP2 family protein [Sediminibacillus dalangtanensis]QTM98627.1 phosphatase PAP2 family protein [Sediminibacillus dalangtanensis]
MKKRTYFFLSFLLLAIVSSAFITLEVLFREEPILDRWTAPAVQGIDKTLLFFVFRWLTELGSGTFLTPFTIVAALFLLLYSRDWLAALMMASGTLLGYRVNHWIKLAVERERPRLFSEAEGVGYSFPSGHAMVSLIAYGLLIYFLLKYVKSEKSALFLNIFGICLILLIGVSRYVIRVHYLTDVLGGYAFGFIFLSIWIGFYSFLQHLIKPKYRRLRL